MVNSVDEVTLSITQSQTKLKEYKQTLQQLSWETFDLLQEKISSVTDETSFLIDLMDNKKLNDDNGQLTNEGLATLGLHGVAYNANMYQADLAAKEAKKLKAQLKSDPYDTELEKRYREMLSLQREYISNAEDEKDAIKDLVENGIELELNALDERINKYEEALSGQKDLYDYQKKVSEQTEEIASLEKQRAAYLNDTSEESKAKLQQIELSLKDAKDELKETEYDKLVDDTEQILSDLYDEYEETLNKRLDNIDYLVSQMIDKINSNSSVIGNTIRESAKNVGYSLSNPMKEIWDKNSSSINNVVETYGKNFTSLHTTTNSALSAINVNLQNIIAQLNSKAATNVSSANKSSVADSKKKKVKEEKKKPTTKKDTKKTTTKKTIKVGGKINAGSAKIYDYAGDKSGERQYYRNDPIYKILKINGNWLQVRYHKLSKGITGWFKKGDVKAYATGKKNIANSELAWTQENGKEFIVRPSDGAILTPVAKGDSVLNANASGNIWDMANSPAEFIKDNLNLKNTDVPNNSTVRNNYTQHLDKVVFSLPNVKNYEQLLTQMQKDKSFEKLIMAMTIDRVAGGSSLAKNKSIR